MEYGNRYSVTSIHQSNEVSNVPSLWYNLKCTRCIFHCLKFYLSFIYQTHTQNIGLAFRRHVAKRVKNAQGDTEIFDSLDLQTGKLVLESNVSLKAHIKRQIRSDLFSPHSYS